MPATESANELIEKLNTISNLAIFTEVPLKHYTSFQVGGPADILIVPSTIRALQKSLEIINHYSRDIPLFIMGKGSNIIPADRGFRGLIIHTIKLTGVQIRGKQITANSGITLKQLATRALEEGLAGLEFAAGIPGTLGGALYMNAGAYGSEIKDLITEAELLDYQGHSHRLSVSELKLSYRHSLLQEKPLIATSITLKLKPGDPETIRARSRELNQKRRARQPLQWPSAGSAFKRPDGYYAGALIEKAGLKGTRVGNAQVSSKHAGFIINRGGATATDIRNLIRKIQDRVYKTTGIRLEPEPRFIGDF
ncbi:MAG: UDP-N-acetylmuramate dehydrogenase [Bacillota bacterium]